jgi:hypothetical protein
MLVRLTPQRGGDGTIHPITTINNTGSSNMTLFDTDLALLGNSEDYDDWMGHVTVRDASGEKHTYERLRVQVQLVRNDDSPWSDWINEYAVVKPASRGVPRLSG